LVERARARGRVQGEPIERGAERLVVRERVRLEGQKAVHSLRPGGRRLTREGRRGEVALGIGAPLGPGVGTAVVDPDEASAAKVLLHAPDGALEYLAHLAGLQVAERLPGELGALLVVGAIESLQVQMCVEPAEQSAVLREAAQPRERERERQDPRAKASLRQHALERKAALGPWHRLMMRPVDDLLNG
jgi:hypothetical protein